MTSTRRTAGNAEPVDHPASAPSMPADSPQVNSEPDRTPSDTNEDGPVMGDDTTSKNGNNLVEGDLEDADELIGPKRTISKPPTRRATKKRRNDDDEEESAYSESEESAYDESSDDYQSEESEEYESEDDDYEESDYDDDYGKKKQRGRPATTAYRPMMMPPGNYYNAWANPQYRPVMPYPGQPQMGPMGQMGQPQMPQMGQPMLPPLINPRVLQTAGGVLTPAQLQEIAKNTIASMLGARPVPPKPEEPKAETEGEPSEAKTEAVGTKEDVKPEAVETKEDVKAEEGEPKEGETKPEGEAQQPNPEAIKEAVSNEIKANLTRMLADPQAKALFMHRMMMQQHAKMVQQGLIPASVPPPMMPTPYYRPPPQMMMRPMVPYQQAPPPRRREKERRARKPMKLKEGEDEDDAPIAVRRATRSAAKKVDFSSIYQDEAASEVSEPSEEEHREEEEEQPKPKTPVKRRGRKSKSREASEDEQEPNEDDLETVQDGQASTSSDGEPTISKILSYRVKKNGEEEFLVKFTGLSYLHNEWVSKDEMLAAKMGATRIKKFLSKPLSEHHYDDKNPFNPDYLQVDRVLFGWDHPTVEDPNKFTSSYLIKWKILPYEEATWEKIEDLTALVPNIEDKISEWRARPSLESRNDPLQLKIGQRPAKDSWQPMPESPVYKNENSLRSYQLEGVNWLVYCWINKQSCIIADEMGLGKTVQSVAFIELLKCKFRVPGPFLVVAPLSTIPHWEREFAAWTDLNVLVYHGSQKSRDTMHEYEFFYKDDQDKVIPNVYRFDVLITTYEMALAGFETLQPIIWRAGIFDEAHRLKNRNSKASEILGMFRLEHKVMLTGTPLQNNLEELYSLLHFLQPQRFASEGDFIEEYGNLEKSEDVQKLQELLRPLMLRRLKEDVEKSIPVKEETVVEVELTALQKRYYRAILEKNFAFLTQGCKGTNAPNLVNTMMELRKCCIHPYLIKGTEDRILREVGASSHDDVMNCMVQASGKLVLVDKLLKKLREQGHKVLIFSQMTRCLDLLSDFLSWRGYPCERIDGSIKGEDRQAAIDRYCDPNSDSFVFLLCTRAGGVGINLTVADTVVIYDSDWNPQNDLQAQARCHRIGQEKSVKVYRLITRNTYEREMFDKAGMKLGLDRAVLQRMNNLEETGGLSGAHAPQLSKKEVETLLKKGAYGILMETDEDSQRFCEEDIDQILSRRTQVIRHGTSTGEQGPKETSLFSKATFAATSDDFDIDLDDPNFWELWAKRSNLNVKDLISGSGVNVDEPRIRRQGRRLKEVDLIDIALPEETEEMEVEGELALWTVPERNKLLDLLLKFGPNRLEKILPEFEGRRTRNDLVACIRALVKFCLEHAGDNGAVERTFREDSEKLLLSNLDFDLSSRPQLVDDSTGKIDLGAAEEMANYASEADESRPGSTEPEQFSRSDLPYQNASRPQTMEFMSFLKGAPSAWLEAVKSISYPAALRMQLVDFIRDVVESNGEALPVPPLPGATPAEGWSRAEDRSLILAVFNEGYGTWHRGDEEFDEEKYENREAFIEELNSRLIKLTMAILKRSQVAAKLAMHQATTAAAIKTRRRRARTGDSESEGSDEDDEEFVEEEDTGRRSRRAAKKDASEAVTKKVTSVFWAKRDQQEFLKVVRGYGLPRRDAEGLRDWTIFSQLGDFSASILRVPEGGAFEEFSELFLAACQQASTVRRRRRTRKEMEEGAEKEDLGSVPGELKATDEAGDEEQDGEEEYHPEQEDSDEEFPAPQGSKTLTNAPTISPARAKSLLDTIAFLDRLRDPTFIDQPDLEDRLSRARRLANLPHFWKAGAHDAILLKAVAKYGFERSDLVVADPEFPFRQIFLDNGSFTEADLTAKDEPESKPEMTASGRKKRATRAQMAAKFRPDTLPRLTVPLHTIDWPSIDTIQQRTLKMFEMASKGTADVGAISTAETASTASPAKRKRASPVKKGGKRQKADETE